MSLEFYNQRKVFQDQQRLLGIEKAKPGNNLGDIGLLFPNNSTSKDMNGLLMLSKITKYLKDNNHNFCIHNIDATIILQKPKLSDYIKQMKHNIAESLDIDISLISIKATTTDYLGFIGKEQGIACLAVCLVNEGQSI